MPFKVYLSLLIIYLFGIGDASVSSEDYTNYKTNRVSQYSTQLVQAINNYDSIAERFSNKTTTLEDLKNAHLNTRNTYKKLEFYLDFRYHEFVEEHINGAPLYKVSRTNNRSEVKAPQGLQILDELVFSEEAFEQRNGILALTKKLRFSYERLHKEVIKRTPNASEIIVASRIELIRNFTLSLSGFDAPASLNSLPETQMVFKSMSAFLEDASEKITDSELNKAIQLSKDTETYLSKHQDFETFDRLVFLKNYVDPLYETLGDVSVETVGFDAILEQLPLNLNSTSLFDKALLDPYFYTDVTEDEDSDALKTLGESLFYDTTLSSTKTVSCATCHNPKLAFTDGLKTPNSSATGKPLLRNTPTLLNSVYADRFFYDLRAFNLEQQAEHVIFNTDEFNSAYEDILKMLQKNSDYKTHFENPFGETSISREKLLKALSSYVVSLSSFNSEFDIYIKDASAELSEDAKAGFNLFMGKASCATCHFPPTFAGLVPPYFKDSESEVLGVLENPKASVLKLDSDKGRIGNGIHTENAWMYDHAFKTTTVRNIENTAPYFHNGAYETLEEVLDFYNKGGGAGQGLDVPNQTLSEDQLDLSEVEQQQLVTFLKALTDNPFTEN